MYVRLTAPHTRSRQQQDAGVALHIFLWNIPQSASSKTKTFVRSKKQCAQNETVSFAWTPSSLLTFSQNKQLILLHFKMATRARPPLNAFSFSCHFLFFPIFHLCNSIFFVAHNFNVQAFIIPFISFLLIIIHIVFDTCSKWDTKEVDWWLFMPFVADHFMVNACRSFSHKTLENRIC